MKTEKTTLPAAAPTQPGHEPPQGLLRPSVRQPLAQRGGRNLTPRADKRFMLPPRNNNPTTKPRFRLAGDTWYLIGMTVAGILLIISAYAC